MSETTSSGKSGSGMRIGIYVVLGLAAAAAVWFLIRREPPARYDAPAKVAPTHAPTATP